MPTTQLKDKNEDNSYKFNYSEFVVDFLGALVPGIVFIFLLVIIISGPMVLLVIQIKNIMVWLEILSDNVDTISMLKRIIAVSNDFWVEIGIFTLIGSYVIGHCFFRKDPKIPDKASYTRICKDPNFEKQKQSWVVQEKENEINIEYPYLFLKEYLMGRGLTHLANIVPWSGELKSTHDLRTKFFINMLKIRLQFYFSNRCSSIRMNEGHVRLMSSIWFISNTIINIGFFSLLLLIIIFLTAVLLKSSIIVYTIVPFIVSITVTLFAMWSKYTIEKYLHYMRVREILYVLETAYMANQENSKILDIK